MTRVYSLRQRLFFLILTPLVLMAVLLGFWRVSVAQRTAEELFDRSLLSAALAISRDVAISGGDALLPSTSDLIRDAAGGEVFYHATGPGGIYVTGYAYPPPHGEPEGGDLYVPLYFEATYRAEPVRVLRIMERATIDGMTGNSTVTVWQRISDRNEFASQLAKRAAALMGGLLLTLALVVWFAVARGLRPLLDLQDAIAIRSPDDLSRIKRPVPIEAQGIVATLNRLFARVEESISAHQVFISNAAHQLRNPAAAVQSMAESLRDAPSDEIRNQRIEELVTAARGAARVTDQLLSMDRLRQPMPSTRMEQFDLAAEIQNVCEDMAPDVLSRGLAFEWVAPDRSIEVCGDRIFIAEAVKNLIDNALKHGGAEMTSITVALRQQDETALITISDDGAGLSPDDTELALGRFSQVQPSDGSGLGLAIAASVAERHGGTLSIDRVAMGASLTMELMLAT
ncbi:sensor histidine kinase [Shimia sp. CNT1-13L.2]|uniref:sensor histidine kinase n=1 Tax=Shimia sp. CNT1-13L.2 TaxID=2959663 RepID=UPI0020CBEE1D|nr:sensor histidine kinase [Shimia sp. CNT1-13L.2]MCP9483453.1 sensor histidine kinase [Shimia sp. CNT1-13L.2]